MERFPGHFQQSSTSGIGRLSYLPDARRVRGETYHILVAAVAYKLTVDSLRAPDRFFGCGSGGGGAMRRALELHADFILLLRLLHRKICERADENNPAQHRDEFHLR